MNFEQLSSDDLVEFIRLNHRNPSDNREELIQQANTIFSQKKRQTTTPVANLVIATQFINKGHKLAQKYTRHYLMTLDPLDRAIFGRTLGLNPNESNFSARLIQVLGFLDYLKDDDTGITSREKISTGEKISTEERKERTEYDDILDRWTSAQWPYHLYVFDFDNTLLKVHSWKDRQVNHELTQEEFNQRVEKPVEDFSDPDFLLDFFNLIIQQGHYLAIVSDQYEVNIEHYLRSVKRNGGSLLDYFVSYSSKGLQGAQGFNESPINLIGRSTIGSKADRISHIIKEINQHHTTNITLNQVIFFDDDIKNVYSLVNEGEWTATGVWLSKNPFGPQTIKSLLDGKIKPCIANATKQREDCIGK